MSVWLRVALCFEAIAVFATVVALVPVRSGPETAAWAAYPAPMRGTERVSALGVFDPALWLGAGVAMAVAGVIVFALSRRA